MLIFGCAGIFAAVRGLSLGAVWGLLAAVVVPAASPGSRAHSLQQLWHVGVVTVPGL